MSKGYPSLKRARKAFERGVSAGYRRLTHPNPYDQPKLAALWRRGYELGRDGRKPKVTPKPGGGRVVRVPDRRPAVQHRRGGFGGYGGGYGQRRGGGWARGY